MTAKPSIWGRYTSQGRAEAEITRYLGDPGETEEYPFYRVRYMPNKKYPEFPYAICAFDTRQEADAVNVNGEVVE